MPTRIISPSFHLWHNNVGACVKAAKSTKTALLDYSLCPTASTTSGDVQSAWCDVRSSMVAVFSGAVRPDASNTVIMTAIISARPSGELRDNASSDPFVHLCYITYVQ